MTGKKGMSPIIATILLIAFAVALGAMIMNWSSGLVAGNELEDLCEQTSLQVRSPVCFSNNKISIDFINKGDVEIDGLVLRIKSPEIDQEIAIKNSFLARNGVARTEIPSVKPEDFVLEVVPKVMTEDGAEMCDQVLHRTTELPVCQ